MAGIVPVRLLYQLTVFGFDVLIPYFQRVIDMSVAIEDREILAQLGVGQADSHPL